MRQKRRSRRNDHWILGLFVGVVFFCAVLTGMVYASCNEQKVYEMASKVLKKQEIASADVMIKKDIVEENGKEKLVDAAVKEEPPKKIIINLASCLLMVYDHGNRVALFPVGPGKVSTPTPQGWFSIQSKEINPSWYDPKNPKKIVESGPHNPLGYRWMLLFGSYGIHGTNMPASIGHYESNGCIRMKEADVEQLFSMVEIGTPVEITYQRIVVEAASNGKIAYYIYPDGYGAQKVEIAEVRKYLLGYGVDDTDENILDSIRKSDGTPKYL